MAEKLADGGQGNAFGVQSGCVRVSEAVGGGQGGVGVMADFEQSALHRPRAEGEESGRGGESLLVDGSGDGQLEALRDGDGSPALSFGCEDAQFAGGDRADIEGHRLAEAAASVGHEGDPQAEGRVGGGDGEKLVEVGVVEPAFGAF